MDFLPTEDQEALRAGVREICNDAFPRERLGELAATGAGFDPALWQTLKELGVFGLLLPESEGGLGLGLADAVLVFEELGRALVPGPLVGTLLAAGMPGIEVGDPVGVFDLSAEEPGRTLLIEHPDVITKLVVLDGPDARIIDASELSTLWTRPVSVPTDPLTPLGAIAALPAGTALEGGSAPWRTRGAVLTAALETGIAMATVDFAVQYAKEREQFGRPIGAFQAVKHMCADMHVRAQIASVAVHSAAVTLDYPEVGDPQRAIASAKLLADEASTLNAKTSIQVHGGMGFTWEVVVHYYLKRGWVHQSQFGDADTHADALAALL
jgi:alkylation response protein AidB-like acyl-CoA dehydrogenase